MSLLILGSRGSFPYPKNVIIVEIKTHTPGPRVSCKMQILEPKFAFLKRPDCPLSTLEMVQQNPRLFFQTYAHIVLVRFVTQSCLLPLLGFHNNLPPPTPFTDYFVLPVPHPLPNLWALLSKFVIKPDCPVRKFSIYPAFTDLFSIICKPA